MTVSTRTLLIGLLSVSASVAVGSCTSSDEPSASGSLPPESSTTSEETVPPAGSVDIARVVEDFEYYGACGNETVKVGRTTYFPVLPRRRDEIDETRYPVDDDSGPSGLMRVVPPGPGDDVGTMILYTDGMARFESVSGRVIWLTDAEQTYNWVC